MICWRPVMSTSPYVLVVGRMCRCSSLCQCDGVSKLIDSNSTLLSVYWKQWEVVNVYGSSWCRSLCVHRPRMHAKRCITDDWVNISTPFLSLQFDVHFFRAPCFIPPPPAVIWTIYPHFYFTQLEITSPVCVSLHKIFLLSCLVSQVFATVLKVNAEQRHPKCPT